MLRYFRAFLARTRELFRHRTRVAAEQDEEFAYHIEMEIAENVRRGMSAADARRAALVRFGGTQRFREETHDARGIAALDNLARDTRFALRRLKRAGGFSTGVIGTLSVGLGVAVGIGAIVFGVLLRDLPYDNPSRLVRVGLHVEELQESNDLHSVATFFHLAQTTQSFTDLGGYFTSDAFALTDGDAAERVTAALMTPSAFDLLGVRPLAGALFARKDTSWIGGEQLLPVLISEDLWRRRYGGDPTIIGRRIEIDHGPRMVIGVLPRSFQFPTAAVSIWYPASLSVKRPQLGSRYLNVIGRLRDHVTIEQAQSELNARLASLPARFPTITPEQLRQSRASISVESLKEAIVARVRPQLMLLGLFVVVVLLIATTNVVNLFLLHTERVGREIAVALSLGASRLALARRFVVEGVLLGVASAVVAVPAAALALSTKFGFTEREIPRLYEVSFTATTALWIVGGAVLIGGLMGLVGLAHASVTRLADQLRASAMTVTRGWRRVQSALVALQVGIALTLLVAASLLGRSFWNLHGARVGFEPSHALTFHVSLPYGPTGITNYGAQAVFHAALMDRIAHLPGVAAVGGALHLPLSGAGRAGYGLELRAADDAARPAVAATGNLASTAYFQAMGIPLRRGRSFQSGDLQGNVAAIVSERLAMSIFGRPDVVGRSVVVSPTQPSARAATFRIVGVVGDVQRERIEDGDTPMVYFPLLRDGDGLPADGSPAPYRAEQLQIVVRGRQLPSASTIQQIVTSLDHRVPAANVRALRVIVDDATARVRLTMFLIAVGGAAALLLGVVGVYSVVSYAANGRMREFGIRLALGAAPATIGSTVLREGLKLVALGSATGLVVAAMATRFLRSLLYGVQPTSVEEFSVATLVLIAVTLVATLIPAIRASRTEPSVVLRGDVP